MKNFALTIGGLAILILSLTLRHYGYVSEKIVLGSGICIGAGLFTQGVTNSLRQTNAGKNWLAGVFAFFMLIGTITAMFFL